MIGIPKDDALCKISCRHMTSTQSKSEIDEYIGSCMRECRLSFNLTQEQLDRALGPVDYKDSLLSANQIQGFFWGGGLGCDGSFGFERRGLGADGASDYRSARPERLHWAGQPDVRGG